MIGKKRALIGALFIVVAMVTSLATSYQPVRASATISSSTLTCNSLSIQGSASTPFVGLRLARGTNVELPSPGDSIYDSFFNGSPVFNVINGQFTIYVTFQLQIPGQVMTFRVYGASVQNGIAWDGGPFSTVSAPCAQTIPAGYPIPTLIPVGGTGTSTTTVTSTGENPDQFVLRTITCDTPLYISAGGDPIGNTQIKAGQTWYVRQRISTDGSGRTWAEVSIGGFIPASCVAGLGVGIGTSTTVLVPAIVDTSGINFFETVYTVKAGDTLGGIALKFGVSVRALAAANGITNINFIKVGQQLIIP